MRSWRGMVVPLQKPMLNLLKGLLSFASALTEYLANRKLIDAGVNKAVANNLHDSIKKIESAVAARRNAKRVPNDPRRRN